MFKKLICSVISMFLFFYIAELCLAADDTLTITTYYPSPFGVYKRLQTDTLGVGDNNSNGVLDSGDVPTTSGDSWIKGNVGIGTRTPAAKLDVYGDIMSDGSNMWMFHTPDDGRRTLYFGRGSNGSVAEWSIQFDAGGSASFGGNMDVGGAVQATGNVCTRMNGGICLNSALTLGAEFPGSLPCPEAGYNVIVYPVGVGFFGTKFGIKYSVCTAEYGGIQMVRYYFGKDASGRVIMSPCFGEGACGQVPFSG